MDKIKPKISFESKLLDLHFAYTDKVVDCTVFKRFLPVFADQNLSISIPTPITVHLEHCSQCQQDLKNLVNLNLRNDQLYVLSRMFADPDNNTKNIPGDIQTETVLFATMDFSLISSEKLKQICLSKIHRQQVFNLRGKILEKLNNSDQDNCDISYADVFEACFPYSKIPGDILSKSDSDNLALHLKSCRRCLSKAQDLIKEIGFIYDRRNSGIATRFSVKGQVEKENLSGNYEEWPVDVEVLNIKTQSPGQSQPCPDRPNINYKKFLARYAKPISIAAAFLLICSLLFNIKSASAISLSDVLLALEDATSVRIRRFKPLEQTPNQTTLMSRKRNIKILESDRETVLFDLGSGLRKNYLNDTNQIRTSEMDEKLKTKINQSLNSNWCIIPRKPADSSWIEVTDQIEPVPEHYQVYELKNIDERDFNKIWIQRVWVDTRNNLPRAIDVYSKIGPKSRMSLESRYEIDYLPAEKNIDFLLGKFDN